MDIQRIFNTVKNFIASLWKSSVGKVILIWVLTMIAGIVLFMLIRGKRQEKNVNLVFATWWENELEDQTFAKLAAEYEAQNQGITINLEKMNWNEIRKSLEGEKPKKTGKKTPIQVFPDIFSIDPYAIYELENNAYLAPLEKDKDSSANVVSIISFINPLYYNIDLLEAAGFDRPPKNQTEFLSYVQRLKETNVNGAGIALQDPRNLSSQLLSWIWAAAGNPETSSFSFTAQEVIDTLKFLNQLKQNLYANPFELSEATLLDAFSKGKIGMMIGSIADTKKLKMTNLNFSITTIPAPVSYTKKSVFHLSIWYAGINSKSEHQEEAKDFVSFLKKNSESIAMAAYAVPGNGTLNRELANNDPYYSKAFDMYEASEMVRELYNSPYFNRLNSIIYREIELMFHGNITPLQCAEAMQRDWESLTGTTPKQN